MTLGPEHGTDGRVSLPLDTGALVRQPAGLAVIKPPQLLLQWQPWWPQFLEHLGLARDSFLHPVPAPFRPNELPDNWRKVFVDRSIPHDIFRHSFLAHAAFVFLLLAFSHLWIKFEHQQSEDRFNDAVIHYDISEYLPELNRPAPAKKPQKGDPIRARQHIVVTPPKPDNTEQLIINAAAPKALAQKFALPDLVVNTPITPAPPVASLKRDALLIMPDLTPKPVAPTPEASRNELARMPK